MIPRIVACFFAVCAQFLSLAYADVGTCVSISYPAPSGSKNDIVFSFDKPYHCGRYANGDWWVSADASEVVVIKSVDPVTSVGFSGIEINPSTKTMQGFDQRISGYDGTLNVRLPLRVRGDSSVVKAVSISAEHSKKNTNSKCRPCLQFAAVLTVLRTPLAYSSGFLRPPYFGKEKTHYALPKDLLKHIPRLPVGCCTEAKYGDFEKILKRYRGVQLDHLENWVGRDMHPIDNMPDFGASIATDNAVAPLRFMLNDFNFEVQTHRLALINYLQMGVDLKGMAMTGMKWPGAGGHGNGRKLPILFAARLLGRDDFLQSAKRAVFSEDEQVYFSEKAGKALYGASCSDSNYWLTTRLGRGSRDCRDPYGYIDGGGHEIGGAYQFCCTAMPWKYTALAVRMLGLEEGWANNAFLEYADRWVIDGVWANPDPCASYNNNPDDYMKVYGPDKDNNCIRGAGRYKTKHGTKKDGGDYRNKFGDQMWLIYRNNVGQVGR